MAKSKSILLAVMLLAAAMTTGTLAANCTQICQTSPYPSVGCYNILGSINLCQKYRYQYCPATWHGQPSNCTSSALTEVCDRQLTDCGPILDYFPVAEPETCPQDCIFNAYGTVTLNDSAITHMRCPGLDPMVKYIVFTFDDGPTETTPQFLDYLRDNNATATFFAIGQMAMENPDTLLRTVREGHIIGQHTYYHINMTTQDEATVEDEAAYYDQDIPTILGFKPRFERPPYGAVAPDMAAYVHSLNFEVVLWNVEGKDYLNPDDPSLVLNTVITRHQQASGERHFIYLGHDILPGTFQAFKMVYEYFVIEQGYQVASLDECLFGATGPAIWSTTRNLKRRPTQQLIIPPSLDDTASSSFAASLHHGVLATVLTCALLCLGISAL
ncbi:hypothetical protein RI367_001651 [Sorochytrium milnesiophthora]